MKSRRELPWLALLMLALGVFFDSGRSLAQNFATNAAAASSVSHNPERIAVRVGNRAVTVGELESRLAGIAPFELAALGASKRAMVHAYVDQVLVRDLLLASAAEERGLDKKLPASYLIMRALSNATLRALRTGPHSPAAQISDRDVLLYYQNHISRFNSPERINLWRILCNTHEEAEAVLSEAKRDPSVQKYMDLAREHSLDKATSSRGGNLGFVSPDGTSSEAGLKVDPALVKAASRVKNGELVAEPVAEGSLFAVVWRRAAVAATKRTVAEASPEIRAVLARERTEAAERAFVADLRARYTHDVNPDLLGMIALPPDNAGVTRLGVALPAPAPTPPKADEAPSAR